MESVEILQYLKNEHLALMERFQAAEAEVTRLKARVAELEQAGDELCDAVFCYPYPPREKQREAGKKWREVRG